MSELEQKTNRVEYDRLERKYFNLIKIVRELIIEFKLDGTLVYVSPQSFQILGYPRENLIDSNLYNIIPPEDWELISETFKNILKKDVTETIKLRLRHFNGNHVNISANVGLLKTEKEPRFYGVISDSTEKLVIEKKLKKAEILYKSLMESVESCILILNREGIFNLVNNQSAAFLGGIPEDFVGKSLKDIFPSEKAEEYLKRNEKIFLSGRVNSYEDIFNLPTGNKIFLVNEYPIKDNNGIVIANQIIATDITDKKETEQKLIKESKKAKKYLNIAGVAIVALDKHGDITLLNKKGHEILQFNEGELIGKNWIESCIPEQIREQVNKVFQKLMQGEVEPVEFYENPVLTKNGEERLIAWHNLLLNDDNGDIIGTLSSGEDITERKKAEIELKRSEQQLSGIISSITDHMTVINREFDIIWANEVAKQWFGRELIGDKCYKAYHGRDSMCEHCNVRDTFNDGKTHEHESQVIRADGSKMDLWSTTSVIEKEDKDKPTLVIQISRDITERKQMERNLREINKFKSELLTRTSHELKTPLISIKGFADILLDLHSYKLDSDMVSIIDEIRDGCVRMGATINKLLNTAPLESGSIEINATQENLSFLIKFCTNELRGVVKERDQSIYLGIHDNILVNIEKEKIHEVVTNLIINSIKNTPPKGIIKINSELTKDHCVISVEDNGIGLTEDEKGKLFKQFGKIERYGMGWDIGIDGTGMGLYISKKIVELHGGKIWAESRGRNKGAKFSFSLPLIKQ